MSLLSRTHPRLGMGTRLRVGCVGQETGFARIRVDLDGEEAANRRYSRLSSLPLPIKLEVEPPTSIEHVRMYLSASGVTSCDQPAHF